MMEKEFGKYTAFETLLEINSKDCKCHPDKWYPTSIDTFKSSIKLDNNVEYAEALSKNLAYNLQYIQYLELCFKELKLSEVLYTMLVKNYVITGMSILEGIFTNLLKSKNLYSTTDVEKIYEFTSGVKNVSENCFFDGESHKFEPGEQKQQIEIKSIVYKKTEPHYGEMHLHKMIEVIENHRKDNPKLLDVSHTIYTPLKRLKELRNRIHLQISKHNTDNDYNAFSWKEKQEMGDILYQILTSEGISIHPSNFEFLKVNCRKEETDEIQ